MAEFGHRHWSFIFCCLLGLVLEASFWSTDLVVLVQVLGRVEVRECVLRGLNLGHIGDIGAEVALSVEGIGLGYARGSSAKGSHAESTGFAELSRIRVCALAEALSEA